MTDQERITALEADLAKHKAALKQAWDVVCEVTLLDVKVPHGPLRKLDRMCRELGVLPPAR